VLWYIEFVVFPQYESMIENIRYIRFRE